MDKQPIKPEDIRKGDLIRWERCTSLTGIANAIEFVAFQSGKSGAWREGTGTHYLLERPEPPFEPKDGTIIVRDDESYYAAVRINGEWMGKDPFRVGHWHGTDAWAEHKLAEGWKILETSE